MVATPQASPRRVADPATILFERKLSLMERLSCRDLFTELDSADSQALTLTQQAAEAKQGIANAKAAVEEASTLATLNVEGKNETERRQNAARALSANLVYQAAVRDQREAERHLLILEADLDAAKRRVRRLEGKIEYNTAIMRFLGG